MLEVARAAAPRGASVALSVGADQIVVEVSARIPIGGGLLPAVEVRAVAVAVPEAAPLASAANGRPGRPQQLVAQPMTGRRDRLATGDGGVPLLVATSGPGRALAVSGMGHDARR